MALEFKMPKLGESVTEGTIGRWLKQPGDAVEQYEPMLEVTTDKVDTEVSAPINGTLAEILVQEGETVSVGTVIARLLAASEAGSHASSANGGPAPGALQPTAAPTTAEPAARAATSAPISPVVARLAAEHHVDLTLITGTGGGGRITKKDVEAFVGQRERQPTSAAQPTLAPTPQAATPVEEALLQQAMESSPRKAEAEPDRNGASEQRGLWAGARQSTGAYDQSPQPSAPALEDGDELVPLSPMRRAIAEHMVRSKRIAPHVTTVMEADLSRIVAHRERTKAEFERQGVKLTFTPYFVQAVSAGLQQTPIVNASYTDNGIVQHQRLNIGVAVAIKDGLIVPVIKDADEKSLLGLARMINDLAERARTRRLQPDDTQHGTFTITNHGVSGSIFAMPVINQPQAAILGIGALQKRVVVVSENGYDSMAIRPMCYLSLTFDHRLLDGATADAFLAAVKRALETYND